MTLAVMFHDNQMPHQNSTRRRNVAPNVIKRYLSLQIDRSTPRRTRGQLLDFWASRESTLDHASVVAILRRFTLALCPAIGPDATFHACASAYARTNAGAQNEQSSMAWEGREAAHELKCFCAEVFFHHCDIGEDCRIGCSALNL